MSAPADVLDPAVAPLLVAVFVLGARTLAVFDAVKYLPPFEFEKNEYARRLPARYGKRSPRAMRDIGRRRRRCARRNGDGGR